MSIGTTLLSSDESQLLLKHGGCLDSTCTRTDILTHLRPMGFSIKFDSVKSGWSVVYIEGIQVIIFFKKCISFSED